MRLAVILSAIGAMLLLAVPGTAARPSKATAQPDVLRIPFAPPVNSELRYAVTRTKSAPGSSSTTRTEEVHLYTPSAEGYVLTIRTVGFVVDGRTIDLTAGGEQSLPAELRPFVLPVSIDVARDGTLVRLRDWPRIRDAIAALPDAMASTGKTAEERESARKIGASITANFLTLTAEQAPGIMLKNWTALFGYGGMELEAEALYESTEEMPSPLLPVNVMLRQQLSLSRTEDGQFRYQLVGEPDPEQSAAVLTRYLKQVGGALDAEKRAEFERLVETVKTMRIENYLDLILDASTGIVERSTLERTFSIPGVGDGSETTTIARLK